MPARRQIDPARQRRVQRVARQLTDAITADRFLARLPGAAELAALASCSVREARYALAVLVQQGYLKPEARGHRVVRRPRATQPLRQVIFVCAPGSSFGAWVAYGMQRRCERLRLELRLVPADELKLRRTLDELGRDLDHGDTGGIINSLASEEVFRDWIETGRPVVALDHDGPRLTCPKVLPNHHDSRDMADEHLVRLGHQRIARVLITSPYLEWMVGYSNYPSERDWVLEITWRDEPAEAILQWLRRWQAAPAGSRPTAVRARTISLTETFVRIARQIGVRVPEDLSVIGFGCRYDLSPDVRPRFTFASSGEATELGETAVDLLTQPDLLAARKVTTPAPILHEAELTVRKIENP